jgi:hypothetical protein
VPLTPAFQRMVLAAVGVSVSLGLVSLACHAARVVICPLRALTGIPCPTCGSTRSFLALLRGEWTASFAFNPLATMMVFGSACYIALAVVFFLARREIPVFRATRRGWLSMAGGVLLLALANWVYLLLRFPFRG